MNTTNALSTTRRDNAKNGDAAALAAFAASSLGETIRQAFDAGYSMGRASAFMDDLAKRQVDPAASALPRDPEPVARGPSPDDLGPEPTKKPDPENCHATSVAMSAILEVATSIFVDRKRPMLSVEHDFVVHGGAVLRRFLVAAETHADALARIAAALETPNW